MYNRILVPLDGSEMAEQALPYTGWLADHLGTPVTLLGDFDSQRLYEVANPVKGLFLDRLVAAARGETLEYLERRAHGLRQAGLAVSCVARDAAGLAEAVAAEVAGDPGALIVMATHGRSGFQRWALGSVANEILRATTNSAWVVPVHDEAPPPAEALSRVVVPLDGSAFAERALPGAVALARSLGLELVLAQAISEHAHDPVAGQSGSESVPTPARGEAGRAVAYLNQIGKQVQQEGGPAVSKRLMHGDPTSAILGLVQETPGSLVAMTTHGRSGVMRLVLGSVADGVITRGTCPMLLVREEPRQADGEEAAARSRAGQGAVSS